MFAKVKPPATRNCMVAIMFLWIDSTHRFWSFLIVFAVDGTHPRLQTNRQVRSRHCQDSFLPIPFQYLYALFALPLLYDLILPYIPLYCPQIPSSPPGCLQAHKPHCGVPVQCQPAEEKAAPVANWEASCASQLPRPKLKLGMESKPAKIEARMGKQNGNGKMIRRSPQKMGRLEMKSLEWWYDNS